MQQFTWSGGNLPAWKKKADATKATTWHCRFRSGLSVPFTESVLGEPRFSTGRGHFSYPSPKRFDH
jgi:hypothetical protein